MQLFTRERSQWGLLELGEAADLPVSTAHRIMTVLKRYGLIVQDPASKKYSLGYAAVDLGRRAASGTPLRTAADPVMRRLAQQTGETVVLTVLNHRRDRALCIHRAQGRHDLRLHMEVGEHSYLHAGASSKVLLAYFSGEELTKLVTQTGLPKLAQATITDLGRLEVDLERIRERGVAFSREETDRGAWGVAVPILATNVHVIAGLGIASPTSRYADDVREEFTQLVLEAAKEIRRQLSFLMNG